MTGVMSRVLCIFLLVLLGMVPHATGLARAQDLPSDLTELSLETLMELEIVTAARHSQKAGDAPATATVITAREIEEFGYRTILEALRSVTGFYATNDRNYSYLGVRGFLIPGDYSNRVLLLIDGYRVNDPAYHSPIFDHTFPVPIEAVKHIEVIKGPASALYGGDALLAVINVITKDGADLNHVVVKGEGGNKGTSRNVLTYGKTLSPNLDVVASGLFFRTNGDAVVKSPGIADIRDADAEQSYVGFGKIRYGDLTLSMSGSHRNKDIPTAAFGTLAQQGSSTMDEYIFTDLRYYHAFDSTKSLSVRTSYNTYNYDGHYLAPPVGTSDSRDLLQSSWSRSEFQFQWDVATWNKLTVGGDYLRAFRARQRVFDGVTDDTLNINTLPWSWGAFVQDEIAIGPQFDLVLGTRVDEYRDSGNTPNYRAAGVYRPSKDTTFKLLYGTASRAPTLYELFYTDAATLFANPNLKIEKITTYEAVVVQALPWGVEGSLSAFQYRFQDLISQVDTGGGAFQFQNVGSSRAQGLELGLRKQWRTGALLRFGGVLQDAKDFNGQRRTNSPRSIENIGIVVPVLNKKTTLAFDMQHLGERRTRSGRDTGESFVTTANLRFRDVFGLRNLDLTVTATNLFNERAFIPGGNEHRQDLIPSPSRAFLFGVQYTF